LNRQKQTTIKNSNGAARLRIGLHWKTMDNPLVRELWLLIATR